jgi:hypothetical protein
MSIAGGMTAAAPAPGRLALGFEHRPRVGPEQPGAAQAKGLA